MLALADKGEEVVLLIEKEDDRRVLASRAPGEPWMAFWTCDAGGGRSNDLLLVVVDL